MSGEPKTLTPEQVVDLAKKYMVAYLEETSWPDELREKWPEELDADYRLLFEEGVRVVARDEAAELRAAARKWREAADRAREVRVSWLERRMEYTVGEVDEAVEALVGAEGVLRRLAGGENEK